jgi:hypothetical protein
MLAQNFEGFFLIFTTTRVESVAISYNVNLNRIKVAFKFLCGLDYAGSGL